MIQNLLNTISALLQTELGGQPGFGQILIRPSLHLPLSDQPTPTAATIALYPGNWTINETARDIRLTEPRPQEFRQLINLTSEQASTYTLSKPPLKGSVQARLLSLKDPPDQIPAEQALQAEWILGSSARCLTEGQDFTIDYKHSTLTLIKAVDRSKITHLSLTYSFPSLFTVQEFQQDFWIEIYDSDFAKLEQWSSLISGILLNSHDRLIEQYNTPQDPEAKTEYQTPNFLTTHTLSQFRLLGGTYLSPATGMGLQLKFTIVGQIKMTKALAEGATAIQKIQIQGMASA